MGQLLGSTNPRSVMTCPEVVAEVGYSARNGTEHNAIKAFLREFPECETAPSVRLVLDIQNALYNSGLVRAVGAVDIVIAAYAIANDAVLVHYDSDFEYVAKVRPDFKHQWIAPRGTLVA